MSVLKCIGIFLLCAVICVGLLALSVYIGSVVNKIGFVEQLQIWSNNLCSIFTLNK